MSTLLSYSMFHEVLFPPTRKKDDSEANSSLSLRSTSRFLVEPSTPFADLKLVLFDFETTGLDAGVDKIIELGAISVANGEVVDEFSSLIDPGVKLPEHIISITGIDDAMLKGQPREAEIVPKFLDFIKGAVLVAHNADFDMAFLKQSVSRLSIDLEWPCFCTLKMARQLVLDVEKRDLDTLANHYGLTFEARHRSIGDVKVTKAVMDKIIEGEGSHLKYWRDFHPYYSH